MKHIKFFENYNTSVDDYLNSIKIELGDFNKDTSILVAGILDYVYSFGNNRKSALYNFESVLRSINLNNVSNKIKHKLPLYGTVYRWIDYRWSKLENLKKTIENGECYIRNNRSYSYTVLNPSDNFFIEKNYGSIIKYNLSKIDGDLISVYIILRWLKYNYMEWFNHIFENNYEEVVSILEDKFTQYENLYNFHKIGFGSNSFYIDKREIVACLNSYIEEQKEVIILSDYTKKICPDNIVRFIDENKKTT